MCLLMISDRARPTRAASSAGAGDAAAVTRLTPSIDWPLDGEPGARLALAGAHGRRIAGATGEAQRLFKLPLRVAGRGQLHLV